MGLPVPTTYLKAKDAVQTGTKREQSGEGAEGAGYRSGIASYRKGEVSGDKRRTECYLEWGAAETCGTVEGR